jgi:putative membrane protein
MKKIILYVTTFGFLSLIAPSCGNNEKDTKEMAEESNDAKFDGKTEKDADRLADSYLSNLFEIEVSQQATGKASTGDVKQLASMLVEKHTAMNEDIRTMANTQGVTLPAGITEEQREKINKLGEKTGMEYDREYTKMMKDKHEKAVDNYSKIAEKTDNSAIREWASATVTEVRSHLDMVNATWEKIKDMK